MTLSASVAYFKVLPRLELVHFFISAWQKATDVDHEQSEIVSACAMHSPCFKFNILACSFVQQKSKLHALCECKLSDDIDTGLLPGGNLCFASLAFVLASCFRDRL